MNFEQKLKVEQDKLDDLMIQWDDPELSKDVSENTPRDILRSKITQQEKIVNKLLKFADIPHIPGTWNVNDTLKITYTKIVAYSKELDLPEPHMVILSPYVEVADIDLSDRSEPLPLAVDSHLGKALLHKSHKEIRFNTSQGYAEVIVERGLM